MSPENLLPFPAADATPRTGSNGHLTPEASADFVRTPEVEALCARALTYLEVGYAVHLVGHSGTGKTTLALHLASCLGQPVMLLQGDDELGSSDLVGRDAGYRRSKLVDNYIHSVLRTEEEMRTLWSDNRLTTACRHGYTLIYDEFTRSRPEANNMLLSVLSEGLLTLPGEAGGYLRVHPRFRAIFTSNPEEYAGTHASQDALLDRLITLRVGGYTRETEIAITRARSGVSAETAAAIVDIGRQLRNGASRSEADRGSGETLRAAIAVGRVISHLGSRVGDDLFRWACRDVFGGGAAGVRESDTRLVYERVDQAIDEVLGRAPRGRAKAAPAAEAREPVAGGWA
jgi:nitric oxide reductase NorQ protein